MPVGAALLAGKGGEHEAPAAGRCQRRCGPPRGRGVEQVAQQHAERARAKGHAFELIGKQRQRRRGHRQPAADLRAFVGRQAQRRGPVVVDRLVDRELFGQFGCRSPQEEELEVAADPQATLQAEIDQFPDAALLRLVEKHRTADVKHEVDPWGHLFAVELQRVVAGAGVGLPVDVPGVVAGHVMPVVLKVEGAAGAAAEHAAGGAPPAAGLQGQPGDGRDGPHTGMDLAKIHAVAPRSTAPAR